MLNQQDPALHFVIPAANAARREQIEALLDGQPDLPVSVIGWREPYGNGRR